jgi:uncharacterized protein YjbI with pentapeptide repeats
MADKLDPFDVEALEKSLGDSALRLSTLWATFLIFCLYIAVAATNVTQHQLLSEQGQIKIPTLDILLPVVPSFLIFPLIFLLFHAYLLTQVALIAQTAAVYNDAIRRSVPIDADRARIRQRLPNTLFAQIFAAPPRESGGLLGGILRLTVWVTLAILPVFVLLIFQLTFLPFHGVLFTWAHRTFVIVDATISLLIWTVIVNVRRDITLRDIAKEKLALLSIAILIVISCVVLTFPGEFQARWTRSPPDNDALANNNRAITDECRSESYFRAFLPQNFDRFSIPGATFVNNDAVHKLDAATALHSLDSFALPYTSSYSGRDFRCANLAGTDFRRADFSYADLTNVDFSKGDLEGTSFYAAKLPGALLVGAKLQSANLNRAQVQGADLTFAELQGSSLDQAQLQGTDLAFAELQGADLASAELQGASLRNAKLQGANLSNAYLQGADLESAQLQGADLSFAKLQGAFLKSAYLQGSSIAVKDQDTNIVLAAILDHTVLSEVWTWRARMQLTACPKARVFHHIISNAIFTGMAATPQAIKKFIEDSVSKIPDGSLRKAVADRIHIGLVVDPQNDDTEEIAKIWADCETAANQLSQDQFDKERAVLLRDVACLAGQNSDVIARGFVHSLIQNPATSPLFAMELAGGLLGHDCPAAKDFASDTTNLLRAAKGEYSSARQ